jgi:pyruvate formate-lyase activating enzyme-like uncharacterized protein
MQTDTKQQDHQPADAESVTKSGKKELIGRSLTQAKIKELKVNIKLATAEFKESAKLTKRVQKRKIWFLKRRLTELATRLDDLLKERKKIDGQAIMVIEALSEELKLSRLNKYSSKFFEYTPSPANRRMRRAIARGKL